MILYNYKPEISKDKPGGNEGGIPFVTVNITDALTLIPGVFR